MQDGLIQTHTLTYQNNQGNSQYLRKNIVACERLWTLFLSLRGSNALELTLGLLLQDTYFALSSSTYDSQWAQPDSEDMALETLYHDFWSF